MDHAVAIVEAYLQINGYFTVAEYPIIEGLGRQQYSAATDLDMLAFRFPGAGRLVPGKSTRFEFQPDPALGIRGGQSDMLIGEVKEGQPKMNRAARNPKVLKTVLARFGCCSAEHVEDTAQRLMHKGEAVTHTGHRVRLVAFGTGGGSIKAEHFSTFSLGHIVNFIESYIREHWEVLHHAQFKHPALGHFMVREKALRQPEGRK